MLRAARVACAYCGNLLANWFRAWRRDRQIASLLRFTMVLQHRNSIRKHQSYREHL